MAPDAGSITALPAISRLPCASDAIAAGVKPPLKYVETARFAGEQARTIAAERKSTRSVVTIKIIHQTTAPLHCAKLTL